MSAVADNIARVRERMAAAAERAGRAADALTLVAVTKKQPVSAVTDALAAGLTDIGENYVQEAVQKRRELPSVSGARWHLLGRLQRNKARDAAQIFDLIQSVDSVALAQLLSQLAQEQEAVQDILLQAHLGTEATKSGFPPEQITDAAAQISEMPGVRVHGLMGIAPQGENPRPHFRALRRLYETLPMAQQGILSLGMTADLETAIEEGSTMVRVGTALFGPRAS